MDTTLCVSASAEMSLLQFSNLGLKLDAVDQVKEGLQKELGLVDKAFFEKVLQHIPQFIVSGAQSAGKSSVVRRISGVRLPEKATRCTRTAVILRLRREPYSPTVVKLKRLGSGQQQGNTTNEVASNEEDQEIEVLDNDVTAAIVCAQDIAIVESGNAAEFAENHWVDVYVRHQELPNITLVDLPGFTNDNDHDTQVVQRMVQRYLEMPGSLVLQVVKADQDYGAVLGNDFLRPYAHKCTSVFTYCDMLDSHQEENVEAWVQKAIAETRPPRFAILGSFMGSLEMETRELEGLRVFQASSIAAREYQLGTQALVKYLEELITNHLEAQLPITIKSLGNELSKAEKRLETIKTRNPVAVVLDVLQVVAKRLRASEAARHVAFRAILDELRIEIHNLPLRAVESTNDESFAKRKLDKLETLGPGTRIYVRDEKGDRNNDIPGIVLSSSVEYDGNAAVHTVEFPDKTVQRYRNDYLYSSDHSKEAIAKEIQSILRAKCGLRNLAHTDVQMVIDRYASDFASRYKQVIEGKHKAVRTLVTNSIVKSVFAHKEGDEIPVAGTPVLQHLQSEAQRIVDSIQLRVDEAIHDLAMWNESPPLTFSPNEHYLNQIFCDMVADNVISGSSDEGSATICYFRVRAYLKVETKLIVEAASKFLVQFYECKFLQQIAECSTRNTEALVHLVREPPGISEERERLTRRRLALTRAIETLSRLS